MTNISTILKEFNLPEDWKRIESPTFYNDEIVPFNQPKVESGGYYQNGNIITKSSDVIRWISMTINNGEHVKCFDSRFKADGSFIDFDINYFGLGEDYCVHDVDYIREAIDELAEYIRENKDRFKIM